MDVFDESKAPLRTVWNNKQDRQQSKLVILQAIATTTEISVKVADEILEELDRLLLDETEEAPRQTNRGL